MVLNVYGTLQRTLRVRETGRDHLRPILADRGHVVAGLVVRRRVANFVSQPVSTQSGRKRVSQPDPSLPANGGGRGIK
eukprot:1216594-Alexandrium_andersonii.AAC.1